MSKYEIAKLNVGGYSRYENSEQFDTAESMFSRIRDMQQNDNGWFYGNGSEILRNGIVIATLNDYECAMMPVEDRYTGKMTTPRPSIRMLMEHTGNVS